MRASVSCHPGQADSRAPAQPGETSVAKVRVGIPGDPEVVEFSQPLMAGLSLQATPLSSSMISHCLSLGFPRSRL